jgi:ATP-dependent Clp protease ATP-binding subunit ClpA
MLNRLVEQRIAKAKDQRYGAHYNFGATYYDARNEALRRGDRTIGTEHLLLAMLVDPASPAAKALGCNLDSARRELDALDREALLAIGIDPKISAGPIAARANGKLRLTPAAKEIFTSIPEARQQRRAGLGKVLDGLLKLRHPDPAADLLVSLGVDTHAVRERFAQLDRDQ